MKKKFCCDAGRGMYEDYYKRQSGGEMPVFAGRRYQRGHGIGSMLSGLFRRVVPFIKDNVKNIGANILRTGTNIAQDMIEGKKFKEAARRHVPTALKQTVRDIDWQSADPRIKAVTPHLLRTAANIGGDVIQGTPFKESLKTGIKRGVQQLGRQTGNKRARRHIKRNRKDIFG